MCCFMCVRFFNVMVRCCCNVVILGVTAAYNIICFIDIIDVNDIESILSEPFSQFLCEPFFC